jgi:hypothetical protein
MGLDSVDEKSIDQGFEGSALNGRLIILIKSGACEMVCESRSELVDGGSAYSECRSSSSVGSVLPYELRQLVWKKRSIREVLCLSLREANRHYVF